jgi:cell cycle sensor histidine kinase DivJ
VRDQDPGIWLQVEVDRVDSKQPDELLCRITDASASMQKQRQTWSFQSVLAHKFRTPLTGMLGSLELLEMDAPDESLPMFECLRKSARRLQDQIASVLKYVEKRHIQVGTPTPAGRLVAMLEEIANETAATVQISGGLPGDVSVRLPEDALLTIFAELLANSLKFHPRRRPVIRIDLAQAPDDCVVLQWRDDGGHIDEAQLPLIGQPYFQAETAFTGETPGLGLGLAMAASLLIECGGRLHVANAPAQPGVIVTLELPATITA